MNSNSTQKTLTSALTSGNTSVNPTSWFLGFVLITTLLFSQMSFGQTNNCSDAAGGQITVGTSCNPTTFNSNNDDDYWNGAAGCNAADRDDAWAWFIATSTTTTITYNSTNDAVLTLLTGTCSPTMGYLACADNTFSGNETITYATTIGTTYRIRIQRYNSDANMNGTICVYSPLPPPANNDCGGAIPLTPNTTCSPTAGTTVSATQSIAAIACGGFTGNADDDVWYSFEATSTSHTITVTPGTLNDAVIELRSGACNGTNITCADGTTGTNPEVINATGLTVGNTYYVRVYSWGGNGNQGTFNICVTTPTPPANDDCGGAIPLTPSADDTCNATAGTTVNATQSLAGCTGTADDDVWYSFVATSTNHIITVTEGTINDVVLEVSDGSCGSFSFSLCIDDYYVNEIADITGFTIGNTYYVRVYSFGVSGNQGTFDICVTTPTITYCEPTSNDPDGLYIDSVSIVGTLSDPPVNNSTFNATGYQDFTGLTPLAVQAAGEGVNIIASSSGNVTGRGGWKAWVDWDGDGNFDGTNPEENIYNVYQIVAATVSFGFVIPPGTPPGDYRLRIRINNEFLGATELGSEDYDACENFNASTNPRSYGETEDYLIRVIENCTAQIISVTDGARCGPGEVILSVETETDENTFNWYDSEIGGNLIEEDNLGTYTPSVSTTTTFYVTATNGVCESLVRVPVVAIVNPMSDVTFDPQNLMACGESAISISASGDTEIVYLIDEDFETGNLGVFTNVNIVNNVNTITSWQNRTSTFVPSQQAWFPAISSGFGTNRFVMATSDVPNSNVTHNALVSPVINTNTFTNLDLSFDMYFSRYVNSPTIPENVNVDISINGGTDWTTIETFNDDIGYGTAFESISIDLSDYTDVTSFRFRIRYYANYWCDGVAVDNIKLFGSRPVIPSFTWTSTPAVDAYLDPTFDTPYTEGTPASIVYIRPTINQLELGTFDISATITLSNGCPITESTTITNNTKVWNGSISADWNNPANWLPNGIPDADNCVIIIDNGTNPDPIVGPPFPPNPSYARNLTVKDGGFLDLQPNTNLTVTDWINVEPTGVFNLKNSASLVQVTNVSSNNNTGNIHVQRAPKSDFSPVNNLNYVYWSSPVENFTLSNISPGTSPGLIWEWIPTILGNGAGNHGNWQNVSGAMEEGKGYIVRGLSGTPTVIPTTSVPVSSNTALFSGIPNNGEIEIDINRGSYTGIDYNGNGNTATAQDDNWNLLGNPYPSSISANAFVTQNTNISGTIYLWPHGEMPGNNDNPFYGDFGLNYNSSYIEHNPTGTVPPIIGDIYIASGQAFMVLMMDESSPGNPTGTTETVTFNNSLRHGSQSNTNFYRQSEAAATNNSTERHRIWLDLSASNNQAHTLLVGYIENATNGFDRLFDGYNFMDSQTNFYSLIGESTFSIQGRALPFVQEDTVPLGITIQNNDVYKIGINTLDGLFENDNQNIYIEDTYLNTIHNIKASPYMFTSQSGTFNDRFILRYTTATLGIDTPELNSGLNIIAFNNNVKVTSTNNPINTVEVYDITGRAIVSYKDVNTTTFNFNLNNISSGTYIVKATLYNGKSKTQKILQQ